MAAAFTPGPAGAVACTGEGEEIIKRAMARSVHEAMSRGVPAKRTVEEAEFPQRILVRPPGADAIG